MQFQRKIVCDYELRHCPLSWVSESIDGLWVNFEK